MDAPMEESATPLEASAPMEDQPATEPPSQPESQTVPPPPPPPSPPPQEAPAPLAKRLEGVVELMQRINRQIEELSLERRAEVSSRQWETWEEFKSSPARGLKPAKFWQNSIFARIYFVDKELDECFHNVVKHGSLFFNHLNAIFIKIQFRAEGLSGSKSRAEDAADAVRDPQSVESGIAAGDASNQQQQQQMGAEQSSRGADKIRDYEIIRQSFTNLIKAKIEFDTQFLNFNSILNKSAAGDDAQCPPDVAGTAKTLLGQTAAQLTTDHRKEATGSRSSKRLRRKSVFAVGDGSRKRLRRSARIASEDDSEVQVIRSLKRRESD